MKQIDYKKYRIFYREKTADELVLQHSFDNDIFLSSIPYYTPPLDATIIDIGAHIGTFSLLIAEQMPTGKIYALEPCKETFDILFKNVSFNDLEKRIIPCKIALSDVDAQEKLYHDTHSGNWGHSIVSILSNTYEYVDSFTLDSFFDLYSIDHCNLIKFNCEGAEFKIIKSASDTTLNKIETWIILFHEDLESNSNRNEIIKRLEKNGYIVRVIRISDDNRRGWITATKNYRQYIQFSIKTKWKKIKENFLKIE